MYKKSIFDRWSKKVNLKFKNLTDSTLCTLILTFNCAKPYLHRMTHTPSRCQALKCMPAIDNAKAELFIKSLEGQAISWSTFANPFYIDMWITILAVAVIIAGILTFIEKLQGGLPSGIADYLKNLWVALKSNFGGEHSSVIKSVIYDIVLFDCLLVGSVVWMAYQASLTSELSVIKLKLPFIDLETLYKSDYK